MIAKDVMPQFWLFELLSKQFLQTIVRINFGSQIVALSISSLYFQYVGQVVMWCFSSLLN